MSEVARRNETLPAQDDGPNAYEIFGSAGRRITGRLLKFNKGDYLAGQKPEQVIPRGTRLVADMPTMTVGWIKWVAKKFADQECGLLSEGYQPPKREELGDTEESELEVDERTGARRDPWQLTIQVVLRPEGDDDDEAAFTFSTSSKTGIGAMRDLSKNYGKEKRARPAGSMPIVELGKGTWPSPEWGPIPIPVMKIVGWTQPPVIESDPPF
jgi:hypothetical protein